MQLGAVRTQSRRRENEGPNRPKTKLDCGKRPLHRGRIKSFQVLFLVYNIHDILNYIIGGYKDNIIFLTSLTFIVKFLANTHTNDDDYVINFLIKF